MAQNLIKLASQGRAYSGARAWSAEELESLLAIESCGEGVPRVVAAEFIRNGITTIKEYEAAVKAEFVPKSFADLQNDAIKEHTLKVRKELGLSTGDSSDEEDDEKTEEELAKEAEDAKVARETLEAKATELDIKFTVNMKNETIEKKIADATKE